MVHVINRFQRPAKKTVDRFRGIGTATVHEASGRKGYVDCAIKPIARGVRICGPAFTVQCHPRDNLMLHKALERAQPGDIIVASVGGYYEAGYWGGLMATSAMGRKIAGLAIDGCVRDSEEMIRMGFPIFCRGRCILGTAKSALGLINHPTLFGGAIVNPGDIILGDDDGVVVVPKAEAATALEKAVAREAWENDVRRKLEAGVTTIDALNLGGPLKAAGIEW